MATTSNNGNTLAVILQKNDMSYQIYSLRSSRGSFLIQPVSNAAQVERES